MVLTVHEKLDCLDQREGPASLTSNPGGLYQGSSSYADGSDVPDTPLGGQKSLLPKDKSKG